MRIGIASTVSVLLTITGVLSGTTVAHATTSRRSASTNRSASRTNTKNPKGTATDDLVPQPPQSDGTPERLKFPAPTSSGKKSATASASVSTLAATTSAVVAVSHGQLGGFTYFKSDGTISGFAAGVCANVATGNITAGVVTKNGTGCYLLNASGLVAATGTVQYMNASYTTSASPAVGIALTATELGFWTLRADGTIANYGDAPAIAGLNATATAPSQLKTGDAAVAIVANPVGTGVWVLTKTGVVVALGGAPTFGDVATGSPTGTTLLQGTDYAVGLAPVPDGSGYWIAAANGGVFSFPTATPLFGSLAGQALSAPVVGISPTPTGKGYLLAGQNSRATGYGDASGGTTASLALTNAPYIGIASTKTGDGYWTEGKDGAIFSLGNAPFYGSASGIALPMPAVSMAVTQTGKGYWLTTADGTLYPYGDAANSGSIKAAGTTLAAGEVVTAIAAVPGGTGYWMLTSRGAVYPYGGAPALGGANTTSGITGTDTAIGMAPTATGKGYWIASSQGGIYAFGDAQLKGTVKTAGTGGTTALQGTDRAVAIVPGATNAGYWVMAAQGGVFAFGDAPFLGSMSGVQLAVNIEAATATPTSRGYLLLASDGTIYPYGDAQFYGTSPIADAGPTGDLELVGDDNPSQAFTGSSYGDPVDTATGAYYESFTDLSAPGRGPSAAVARSYSSKNASKAGAFGYGWSTPEGAHIDKGSYTDSRAVTYSTRTVTQENGSTITFACNPTTGQFVAAKRVFATLVQYDTASGTDCRKNPKSYALMRNDSRSTMNFDGTGHLMSVVDQYGYTLTITRDAQFRIMQMVHGAPGNATPRGVAFTRGANGYIASATDIGAGALARTVTYGYDGAGNLTTVTVPGDGVWKFTYDAAHRLITKQRPTEVAKGADGKVFTNTYDAVTSRVTSQVDEAGATTLWVAVMDTKTLTGKVTITDPSGNVTVEQYKNAMMIQRTTGFDTALEMSTLNTFNEASLLVTKTIVRPSNKNPSTGKVPDRSTTRTYYDSGAPWQVTAPDGTMTQYYNDPWGARVRTIAPDLLVSATAINTWGDATVRRFGPSTDISPYWSQLLADHSGKCIGPAVPWASVTAGTQIVQRPCTSSDDQSFRILWGALGAGALLAGPNTKWCVAWAGSGAALQLQTCDGANGNQLWDVHSFGNVIQIQLRPRAGGAADCFTVTGDPTTDGAVVNAAACLGVAQRNQLFRYQSRPQGLTAAVQTTTYEHADAQHSDDTTAVVDAGTFRSTAQYDSVLGLPTIATDAVGNVTVTQYDQLGRPTSVRGPRSTAKDPIVSTIAGTGAASTTGNNGLATSATLNVPYGMTRDAAGNLYVSEKLGAVVRKITPAGIISTFAGGGSTSPGDGGLATNAKLLMGRGLAVYNNALYIADQDANRIRKVDLATNIISTVVGTGTAGYSGDGGSPLAAKINAPLNIAFDGSTMYFSDNLNARIRAVDLSTSPGTIRTVAGNGASGFTGDGGLATAASISGPGSVIIDAARNILFVDAGNHRIRKVDATTGIITTIAGSGGAGATLPGDWSGDGGPAVSATLYLPRTITLDGNDLYISDYNGTRIRRVNNGTITTVGGTSVQAFGGDGMPVNRAMFASASEMLMTPAGDLLVADAVNNRIRKLTGMRAAAAAPATFTATTTYNAAGLTASVTDPLGNTSTSTYDPDGRTLTATAPPTPESPSGATVSTTYDSRGLKSSVTTPDGLTRSWQYDAAGRPSVETDTAGNTITASYDIFGRLMTSKDPLGRQSGVTKYSAFGEVLSATDRAGLTTTNTYDIMGRLTATDFQDANTPDLSWTYDTVGRQKTVSANGVGITTRAYDVLGRLSTVTDVNGNKVSYTYDARNLITTLTYPALGAVAAPKVTNTFDAKGRLSKVTDWNNKAFTFGYDEASNPVSVAYPNGWSEANTFDGGNRLTKITQTNTALGLSNSYTYSLDNRSRAIQATTSLNGVASTDTYTYDTRSRLATWNAQAYSFDAQGNLTAGPNLGSFAYDQGGQLCNSSKTATASCVTPPGDATTYGFDQRGNRVSVTPTGTPAQAWAFNQRDQLVASPDGATYRYDGEGLRTSLTSGATTTRFTWDRSSGLPLLLSDGTNAYVYGPSGAPLEQISATNTTTYLHTDRLRSVRALSDSTGNVTATRTYDPYGNPTTTTGTYNTPFGYAGEYTDANTGLIYLRARYYQPSTGQFINEDPAVSQTKQPYLYAGGDPINHTDPSGLDPYTFTFDVGQGPPEDIAAFTHANCSSVFPIRGCKDNFAVGDVLSLKGFGQSFPVRVESISTASWTFVALQGHPEGAGRKITFDFSYDSQKNTTKLTTSTSTEGSWLTTWPAKTINFRIAKRTWRSLAENIRTSYQVTRARVIGSSINAATAKYWVG